MTLSFAKDVLAWARQWPSAATMIVGTLMLGWIVAAETGRVAKAEDIQKVKDDFTQIVNQKVAPLNAGFQVILRSNIEDLSDSITRLEFKRDRPPPNDWTEDDEFQLRELLDERDTQQAALNKMIQSSRDN